MKKNYSSSYSIFNQTHEQYIDAHFVVDGVEKTIQKLDTMCKAFTNKPVNTQGLEELKKLRDNIFEILAKSPAEEKKAEVEEHNKVAKNRYSSAL